MITPHCDHRQNPVILQAVVFASGERLVSFEGLEELVDLVTIYVKHHLFVISKTVGFGSELVQHLV